VCQTGLRVTSCAGAQAICDVLEDLAAGVEERPLAVGVIEVALVPLVALSIDHAAAKTRIPTAPRATMNPDIAAATSQRFMWGTPTVYPRSKTNRMLPSLTRARNTSGDLQMLSISEPPR